MSEYEKLVQQIFDSKWIINGFPKSGTHLLVQLIAPIAPYQPATEVGLFARPWSGTFLDNSWTNRWAPIEQTCIKLGRVQPGYMLKGHLGYMPELDRFLQLMGAIHIFIYRDLRDVAVSQAYHIVHSSKETLSHPDPERYTDLGNFADILAAVISGIGPFPGVIARWEHYTGWFRAQCVMTVKFEDVIADPKLWAERIFRYAMKRSAGIFGRDVLFDSHGLDVLTSVMATATKQTDRSPTFRKGNVGDWRQEFGEQHIDLWRKYDVEHWLERLGYEGAEWYETGEAVHQRTEDAAATGPTLFEAAAPVGA
jgi:hypothetical protein